MPLSAIDIERIEGNVDTVQDLKIARNKETYFSNVLFFEIFLKSPNF